MELTHTPVSSILPHAGVPCTSRRISFSRLWSRSGIRNGPTALGGRAVTGATPRFAALRAANHAASQFHFQFHFTAGVAPVRS